MPTTDAKADGSGGLRDVESWEYDADSAPPPDSLFRALAHPYRRRTLRFLLDQSVTTLDELTTVLVGRHPDDGTHPNRERVSLSLSHRHVPVLDSAGLVDFDHRSGEIRCADLADPVRDLIGFAYRYDRTLSSGGVA